MCYVLDFRLKILYVKGKR